MRLQVKQDATTLSPEETEQQLEHVQEAYDVLSSSKLRQQYDNIGYSGEASRWQRTSCPPARQVPLTLTGKRKLLAADLHG